MSWGTTGATVVTSKESSSSILFAKNGVTPIRQYETVETTEIRGLTEVNAKSRVGVTDSTVQTTYYTNSLGDGVVYSFTALTNTKTEITASRVDETGQWVAVQKVHTYSTSTIPNTWGTSKIDSDGRAVSLSSSGVSRNVSYDKSMGYVFSYNGNTLYSTNVTEVTEIAYIDTQAHANAIVSSNTTNSLSYSKVKCVVSNGTYTLQVASGTEKHASAHYVDAEHGWSVTVTATTHGWANASNNTNNWVSA
jgi:hypothetical protein